eukprot:6622181-Prymnesium_polylepis.1
MQAKHSEHSADPATSQLPSMSPPPLVLPPPACHHRNQRCHHNQLSSTSPQGHRRRLRNAVIKKVTHAKHDRFSTARHRSKHAVDGAQGRLE